MFLGNVLSQLFIVKCFPDPPLFPIIVIFILFPCYWISQEKFSRTQRQNFCSPLRAKLGHSTVSGHWIAMFPYNTILFIYTIYWQLPTRGFLVTIYNSRGNQVDIALIAIYNCFLQIKSNVGFWPARLLFKCPTQTSFLKLCKISSFAARCYLIRFLAIWCLFSFCFSLVSKSSNLPCPRCDCSLRPFACHLWNGAL